MGRIYAIRSQNTMFPAGESSENVGAPVENRKVRCLPKGYFSAGFDTGNGADFGNFYVRLLGKAWYPVFLSDTIPEGVEIVFSMSWTSANILTGESYSACRDCWRNQVRKGGKVPDVARLQSQKFIYFRGLYRDGRLPFRRGIRSESVFRTSWKVPQNIFPWRISPLFCRRG